MGLSELSIRRPVFAWMLMAALLVFGFISFKRLGVSNLPDVDFPVVSVSLSLNGAAPEVMEAQVVDTVEDSIMQIEGIRELSSTSQMSSASIKIEFDLDRNIDVAVQEVQNRIMQVQSRLPVNMLPPTVRKSNPEDTPILWVALTVDKNVPRIDMMSFARNQLMNQLAVVDGVGDVALGGYVDPSLRVWVDLDKLHHYELDAADVTNAISAEHVEVPVGRIENGVKEYNVRLMGEAPNPTEFGKLVINNRGGGSNFHPVQLKDVAKIEEDTADVRRISRYNGMPAVGLGILKQHGSNAVEVAEKVRERVEELKPMLPPGYHIDVRSDSTRFIRQSVDSLNFVLLLSALLTSVVCYLFLGSWTSTMNVLLAIPTSIVGTFIALYFFGFTLNTFTLLGLSLSIGIVVDDAIMMLENIVRHRELGEKRKAAALKGAKEITFAALAATIAVVAIFLPVVFMKGVIGRYFYQYGITVAVAVLLSLLEALTLTPMRCSQYLRVAAHPTGLAARVDRLFHALSSLYGRLLAGLLRHRWTTLFVALLLFAASVSTIKLLKSEMMPAQDQSMLLLRVKGPVGSAIEFTDAKFRLIEDYLSKQKDVDGYFSSVGGFGGDSVNQGMVMITLVDKSQRKATQADLAKRFREELKKIPGLKGIQMVAQDTSTRGFSSGRGFPVEFIVQGPDWKTLTDATNKFIEDLNESGVVNDVNTDIQPGMPEFHLVPNRDKLASRGVSLKTVTQAMNDLVGGNIMNGQTEYAKDGRRYQIETRLLPHQRKESADIHRIKVRNQYGEMVPLADLVDVKQEPALLLITRLNRFRSIQVYGNIVPGHSQSEALKTVESLARTKLPPGYTVKMTGSAQSFRESFDSLVFALLLGILVSYMVLASQFNSFVHPVVVLLALPFSVSGAFVGLLVTHQSINMYSMIGLILLMGIVKKNSILLVDFTNQLRRDGAAVNDALLRACPVRLRPILMTSIATVAGALPEAIAIGPGAEVRVPMAVAIIGGVIASTVLTLLVVPCAYSLMTRLESHDPLAPAPRGKAVPAAQG